MPVERRRGLWPGSGHGTTQGTTGPATPPPHAASPSQAATSLQNQGERVTGVFPAKPPLGARCLEDTQVPRVHLSTPAPRAAPSLGSPKPVPPFLHGRNNSDQRRRHQDPEAGRAGSWTVTPKPPIPPPPGTLRAALTGVVKRDLPAARGAGPGAEIHGAPLHDVRLAGVGPGRAHQDARAAKGEKGTRVTAGVRGAARAPTRGPQARGWGAGGAGALLRPRPAVRFDFPGADRAGAGVWSGWTRRERGAERGDPSSCPPPAVAPDADSVPAGTGWEAVGVPARAPHSPPARVCAKLPRPPRKLPGTCASERPVTGAHPGMRTIKRGWGPPSSPRGSAGRNLGHPQGPSLHPAAGPGQARGARGAGSGCPRPGRPGALTCAPQVGGSPRRSRSSCPRGRCTPCARPRPG